MIAPAIAWAQIAPILIVLGAAIVAVLVEALAPARARRPIQLVLTLLAVAGAGAWALILALSHPGAAEPVLGGHLLIDPFALFTQVAIAASALLAVFVIADRTPDGEDGFTPQPAAAPGSLDEDQARAARLVHTEVYPLMLFATGGMMVFPAAGDLLTMFVALEVLSLPLYLLTGLARHRRLLSQEASFKYFILGAFASAFFLFGAAWVYGATGTISLTALASAVSGGGALAADPVLYTGLALIVVGLGFKIGAAPFHMWTPDVYQGAPTSITAFMAACTKIAAFGALLRIVYTVIAPLAWDLRPALWTVTILTMIVGTAIALTQHDIVRMLAYSAIAHAGFILTGVVSFDSLGISGALFYLFTYGLATVGAFGVVALVRSRDAEGNIGAEVRTLERWRGLGRTSPLTAGAMTIFLLAFAGIPLTSGFVGKFAVFAAAFQADAAPLAIVGIACSAVAAFFYARIIVAMFFSEPDELSAVAAPTEGLTPLAIGVAATATVVLGIWPSPVLDFAEKAALLLP
ncbi:MAG: NADH-quinone oxidoreductase subunit NuoN [Bifidobacteriaceae bacterium]|jgi:NADH-quinone oxidoreductase subunit N|nr:NADH-quinone oxidoreductase subunit NuoN [Bifidobacteriaceae bacterium]